MATLERFVIDPKASRFSVKAVASGMTAGLGHSPISIRDFDGEAQFVPGTLDAASLTGSGHDQAPGSVVQKRGRHGNQAGRGAVSSGN